MSKTREEKIEAMAKVIADSLTGGGQQRLECGRAIAAEALDAAERETPKWPTDESIEAWDDIINDYRVVNHEKKREALEAAMQIDPVFVAAVEFVNDRGRNHPHFENALVRAVEELRK